MAFALNPAIRASLFGTGPTASASSRCRISNFSSSYGNQPSYCVLGLPERYTSMMAGMRMTYSGNPSWSAKYFFPKAVRRHSPEAVLKVLIARHPSLVRASVFR